MTRPDISIIVVSYNTRKLLLDCLKSVFLNKDAGSIEVFVVDNGSGDGSQAAIAKEYPQVCLIQNQTNLGFAGASNQALGSVSGDYVVLLNSDTEIRKDSLRIMRAFLDEHQETGVVGPRLVYEDGAVQPSVDHIPNLLTEFLHLFQIRRLLPSEDVRRKVAPMVKHVSGKTVGTYFDAYSVELTPKEVDCVSGACLMVRRSAIDKTGPLDDSFFMYMEDMDWCIRIKNVGYKVFYLPEVEVIHHVGSSGEHSHEVMEKAFVERYRSRLYFFDKHRGRIARFAVRLMTVVAFTLRWPFSNMRKACGQVIKTAIGRKIKVQTQKPAS